MTPPQRLRILIAALSALFVALAWPGAGVRGLVAEEIEPYLRRYPVVLEWSGGPDGAVVPMPPYEPGAPPPPRWVATGQWPVVAYDGRARMWPVFIRGHQTALASYVGIALGPLLGGGIAGLRRATVLLGLLIVALTGALAWRTNRRAAPWATAIVAMSWGMICIARTAEAFEVGSRGAMMLALVLARGGAARGSALGLRRAALVGVAAAIAVLCRATIVVALVPALAVLTLAPVQRRNPKALAVLALVGLGLPVALVVVFGALVPFREGTVALAGFPLHRVVLRLTAVPRHALLELAWLGNAMSVWGPLARGELRIGSTLWWPAFAAAIPVLAAVVRARRGTATTGERLLLATLGASIVLGAGLYDDPNQFQLALAVEPFFALAIADQVIALFERGAQAAEPRAAWPGCAAGVLALAVRAQGTAAGLALDAHVVNPMLSGAAQHAAVARLRDLGVRGPEVMTTVYNQAGVIEGWTDGAIRPLHAWPVLSGNASAGDCSLQAAWRALLGDYRPRYVLLTEGPNLFESGGMDAPAIARSLRRASAVAGITLTDEAHFPTEATTPGWALVRIGGAAGRDGGDARAPLAIAPECEGVRGGASREERVDATQLDAFGPLRPGDHFGEFSITALQRVGADAGATVRVTAQRDGAPATFEIKPEGVGGFEPPARGGGYAIFYVNPRGGPLTPDDLARGATALAARLGAAPAPR